jgi:hypothetical protein
LTELKIKYVFECNGCTVEADEDVIGNFFRGDVFEEILLYGVEGHSFLK